MISTDTDLFHHDIRVAVSTYGDLIISESDEVNLKFFRLIVVVYAFKDSVRWIWGFIHIEETVLAAFVHEISLVVLFTNLAFRFLVRIEKSVVLFPFCYSFRNPVFETVEVNILNSSHAFAKTDQRVLWGADALKTDSAAFVLVAALTFD